MERIIAEDESNTQPLLPRDNDRNEDRRNNSDGSDDNGKKQQKEVEDEEIPTITAASDAAGSGKNKSSSLSATAASTSATEPAVTPFGLGLVVWLMYLTLPTTIQWIADHFEAFLYVSSPFFIAFSPIAHKQVDSYPRFQNHPVKEVLDNYRLGLLITVVVALFYNWLEWDAYFDTNGPLVVFPAIMFFFSLAFLLIYNASRNFFLLYKLYLSRLNHTHTVVELVQIIIARLMTIVVVPIMMLAYDDGDCFPHFLIRVCNLLHLAYLVGFIICASICIWKYRQLFTIVISRDTNE